MKFLIPKFADGNLISKVLIANRGEIACRIIRACEKYGITSVAVFSDPDKDSKHKSLANEAYSIGGSTASESYLNIDKILQVAKESGCNAIHPGYGFLSENFEFNKRVREAGLIFIGPNPESMKILGSKTASRDLMIKNNIPVVPGFKSNTSNIDEYIDVAKKIGYPILIKAADGGGGKGMRIVHNEDNMAESILAAKRESLSAFGSEEIFLEKYIISPRHIEFQVAGDSFGNYIHLFERECSIQRRHQKIIEETPSVALDNELRNRMGETAISVVKAANYDNIGTVEFLLDDDKNFYFLEVNARIQVEHPITEETTGIDLVILQFDIANGEKLPFQQSELSQKKHSIECRIYAEDSENNFMPSPGQILFYNEPNIQGARFDSGITTNSLVPTFYDPILSKLIVAAETREEAINKTIEVLKNYPILGVVNTTGFLIECLAHVEFRNGNTKTDFIDKNDIKVKHDLGYLNQAIITVGHFATEKNDSLVTELENIGHWEICSSKY